MGLGISQQNKQPFAEGEKRPLALRTERIDPARLIDGEAPTVEAEYERIKRLPTHEARFYEITGLPSAARIQLNHRDSRHDEARLVAIAENLLSAEPISLLPEIRDIL